MNRALKRPGSVPGLSPSNLKKAKKANPLSDTEEEGEDEDDEEEMEVDALLGGTSMSPQNVDSEPDDQWLQDIDEEDSKEGKGPPVNEQLAKMADRQVGMATAIPKVKGLQDKYLIPGNCKDITIPKVKGEVWQKVVQQDSRALQVPRFQAQ